MRLVVRASLTAIVALFAAVPAVALAQPGPGPLVPAVPPAPGDPAPAAPAAPPAAAPAPAAAVDPSSEAAKPSAPEGNLANDLEARPVREEDVEFSDQLVLATGRHEFKPPSPDKITFNVRGEYQLRYRAMTDLRLDAPIKHAEATTLGQNQYLYQWLRLGARFQFRDKIGLIAQIDVPRGLVVGDKTQFVNAVRDPLDVEKWYEVHPRYLYLEYASPIGVFRVGQQGSYWGMGILANDGDHPTLFGDYSRGALTERLLFATTPMGKGTPLTIVLAGNLVFQDSTADLVDDKDRAFQGVAAILYRTKAAEIGVYGVIRHQERDRTAVDELTPFVEELTVGVVDWSGKFNARIAGARAYVYGQFEAALIVGSTTFLRSSYVNALDPTSAREAESIRSFGAAAKLGAVHVAGMGKDQWGDVVGELEAGYASGDADPYDGTTKRFTFDANHNVGLVLFDQVLHWKTARAATNAGDPELVARAAPGIQLLPSKGGVFGAQYLNPRMIFRPRRWVDLKTGVVVAQTTADLVDPYHVGLGNARNYDGGDPRRHDLGVEIDLGADFRIPVERNATVQIGAEAGFLFPGHAFDDAAGNRLSNQYLANIKLGLQF